MARPLNCATEERDVANKSLPPCPYCGYPVIALKQGSSITYGWRVICEQFGFNDEAQPGGWRPPCEHQPRTKLCATRAEANAAWREFVAELDDMQAGNNWQAELKHRSNRGE